MRFNLIQPETSIEAIKFTGKNADEIRELVDDHKKLRFDANNRLFVGNYEHYVPVNVGDWISVNDTGMIRVFPDVYLNQNYVQVKP